MQRVSECPLILPLLTGLPHVGKTSVCKKPAEREKRLVSNLGGKPGLLILEQRYTIIFNSSICQALQINLSSTPYSGIWGNDQGAPFTVRLSGLQLDSVVYREW